MAVCPAANFGRNFGFFIWNFIDFNSVDVQIDSKWKKASWQGVALLRFADEVILKKTLRIYQDKLPHEENKRNSRDNDRFYVWF